ncbi:hypothetical protein BSBH6_03769 [Bacillus subtilis]|nr:hypothetical protein BSBH6_03769 [Bacillus subtilis]RPK20630.1 hypothetical protein BH5_03847 [Bacillus subtilis]
MFDSTTVREWLVFVFYPKRTYSKQKISRFFKSRMIGF